MREVINPLANGDRKLRKGPVEGEKDGEENAE